MSIWRQRRLLAMLIILLMVSLACGLGGEEAATDTPAPTVVAATDTPTATETPLPTETPAPTETSVPTATAIPPTATVAPEPTATATLEMAGTELLTYTSFAAAGGGLSLEYPQGWAFDDVGGFYLWASDEALLELPSLDEMTEGAVGFVEYQPLNTIGFFELTFLPEPGAMLAQLLESELAADLIGEASTPLQIEPLMINGLPAARIAGEVILAEVAQPMALVVVYLVGAEAGALFYGLAPAGADASYLSAIQTIPTTINLTARSGPATAITCSNENETVAITHPAQWYSSSDDEDIYLAPREEAQGEFVAGETTVFVTGGPIDDLDLDGITNFDDPVVALDQFIGGDEVTGFFEDISVVQPSSPVTINGLAAAQAVLALDIPDVDGRYHLLLTFYVDEGLLGAVAAFVELDKLPADGPPVEAIAASFTFAPAGEAPCDHRPTGMAQITPLQPGHLLSPLRLDFDQTGVFSFRATGETTVLAIASAEDFAADLVLELRSVEGLLLDSVDFGIAGASEFLQFDPVAGTEYHLHVYEYAGERAVYNVALVELGTDSPQLLATVNAELALNDAYQFSWNNVVGEPFLIMVSGPVDMDLVLEQLSAGGGNAQYADDGLGGEPERIVVLPVENQTYQFEITDYYGQPGLITIQLFGLVRQ